MYNLDVNSDHMCTATTLLSSMCGKVVVVGKGLTVASKSIQLIPINNNMRLKFFEFFREKKQKSYKTLPASG
jgi:hypothetical protein